MTGVGTRTGARHLAMRAMSTEVTITVVDGDPSLLEWARARVDELEARWSRFLPDSELSRLNAAGGRPLTVSADTVRAVRAACAAWVHTGRRFDPTVHDSLLRLGYDASIELVRTRTTSAAPTTVAPAPGCAGIAIDEEACTVAVPDGVRLDLGGIGKGLAADLTAEGLMARGARGALVNIGGDLRVAGESPRGGPWRVDVEDPRTEHPIATVELCDGGVATSTTLRRRWLCGSEARHHLVEPRTGAPAAGSVVGVTVMAGTAAWADALSKVPIVDPAATDVLAPTSALVMFADGSTVDVGPAVFERVGSA